MKLSKDIKQLTNYLESQRWLNNNESIESTEKPGEGNMNFTLRLKTTQRSVIIKQSREYVEKYPQVAAPKERALMEAAFYEIVASNYKLKRQMPTIIGVDKENSILLMEDLGEGSDYSFIYKKGKSIEEKDLFQLIDFAADLHNSFDSSQVKKPIRNRAMRKLNYEHIYIYPYLEDNGINLDDILPGLAEVAKPFKVDEELKIKVQKIGEQYLADGNTLLHGDYFPGSWLKTADGIKIIDPEFCFFGSPEFEIGVTVAHLKMADQSEELIQSAIKHYQLKAELNEDKMNQFCAIEILRRIMGLAQLPLEIELEKRKELLEAAASLILNVKS